MPLALDFGCGYGANLPGILRQGYRYCGVDISEEAIRHCRRRYNGVANADFIRYGGDDLPFADGSVQAVFAFDVLEHVDDLDRAVGEIRRVLAPGGTVHVTLPNPASEKWVQWFYRDYWHDVHHRRALGPEDAAALFPDCELVRFRREEGIQNLEFLLLRLGGCRIDSPVGSWTGDNAMSRAWRFLCFSGCIWFSESVFKTRYRWLPLWLVGYPLGRVMSRIFPKTHRYVFQRKDPE